MYYFGLLLLAIGSVGLTLFSYFSVFGVPIFILGVVLVMLSKGKTLKQRLIPLGGFIIGIFSFWSIWISLHTLDTEVFLIPEHFQGKVNVIFSSDCGDQLEQTKEGIVYHIPQDGILIINGELKTGIIDHRYFYVDSAGHRTEIEKMSISEFDEDWKAGEKNYKPVMDQLGIFYWGLTGSFSQSRFNESIDEQQSRKPFQYMEFYVSTFHELDTRFNHAYDNWFDSLKHEKIQHCE